jgi:hypothetical protein
MNISDQILKEVNNIIKKYEAVDLIPKLILKKEDILNIELLIYNGTIIYHKYPKSFKTTYGLHIQKNSWIIHYDISKEEYNTLNLLIDSIKTLNFSSNALDIQETPITPRIITNSIMELDI